MVLNTEWAQVEVIDLINDGSGLAFGIIGGRSTGVVVKTILPGGVADRDGRLQSGDHILQIGEVNLRGLGSEQVASVLRQCGIHVRMVVARPVESSSAEYQSLGSHASIVPTKILADPVELDKHLLENGLPETLLNPPGIYETSPFIYSGLETDAHLHAISGLVDVVKNPIPIGDASIIRTSNGINNISLNKKLTVQSDQREPPETETFIVHLIKDDLGLGITIAGYVCEKEEISGIFVKSISQGSAADMTGKIKINDRIVEVNGESILGFTNYEAVDILRNAGQVVEIKFERYLRGPKFDQLQQAIRANELRPTSLPSPTSTSTLPQIPFSLVKMSHLGIEVEGESRTSFDFDSGILQENSTTLNNEENEWLSSNRKSIQFSISSHESIYERWQGKLDDRTEIVIAEMSKEPGSGLGISLEGTVDVEDGKEIHPHHFIRNILPDGPVGKNGVLQSGDELLEVNGIQLLDLNHLEVVSILKQLPDFVKFVCARYPVPTRVINTAQHREAFQARKILAGSLQTLIPTNDHRLVKAKSETSIGSSMASDCGNSENKSRSLEMLTGLPIWSNETSVVELNKGEHGLGFSILDYQDPLCPQESVIVIRSVVPGGVAQFDGRLIPGDRLMAVNGINLEHATLDKAAQVLKGSPKGIVRIAVAKPVSSNENGSYASQDTEDDQTCLDDFQECLEEYQECLDVVHISLEGDDSFNNSPCTSQVEDLGEKTPSMPQITTMIENNITVKQKYSKSDSACDSDVDVSFKSTTCKPSESSKSTVVTAKQKRRRLCKTDSLSDKVSSQSEKDDFETCIDEPLSEETNKSNHETDNLENYQIVQSNAEQVIATDVDVTPTNSKTDLRLDQQGFDFLPKRLNELSTENEPKLHKEFFNTDLQINVTTSSETLLPRGAKKTEESFLNQTEIFPFAFIDSSNSISGENTLSLEVDTLLSLRKTETTSEPCLSPQVRDKPQFLGNEELKSYDDHRQYNPDEFFLVQYPPSPPKEVIKSMSHPNVVDFPFSKLKRKSYRRCVKEYYNDYEDCLELYKDNQIVNKREEMHDDDIFNNLIIPFKSRSAPDIMDRSFVTLTYDPGPEKYRRKSDFVSGNKNDFLIPMTVIKPLVNEYGAVKTHQFSEMLEKHWGSTHTVKVYREPNTSLGISIVGGKVDIKSSDNEHGGVMGIFVKNVVPNTPAGRTGMFRSGDRILEVGGISLQNTSHENAVQVIRNASNPVVFIVQSLKSLNDTESIVPKQSSLPIQTEVESPPNHVQENHQDSHQIYTQDSIKLEEPSTSQEILNDPPTTSREIVTPEPEEGINQRKTTYTSDSEEEDDEDTREMEGRTVSARGMQIDRASAANVKRTKDEINTDPEKEDDFGYTTNKVKKKYANLGHSIVMVQIERSNQGLGLSLAGHKDRNCMAVFVCGLNPKGAAFKAGGIQVGDEILEVNGVVLHGRCHLNASAIIKGLSGPIFKIIILRRKTAIDDIAVKPITQFPVSLAEEASEEHFAANYPNVRTVSIKKGSQSLGIMIIEGKHAEVGQGIFISDIQEGSAAEKAGLEIGEMILAVNKDSLVGSNYDTAANLLKKTEGLVTLVVSNPGKKDSAIGNDVNKNSVGNALKVSGPPSRPATPVPEGPSDPATCAIHPGCDTTIEVTTENKGLGCHFVGGKDTQITSGIVLVEISKGGMAEKDGRLQAGDQILDVNGVSLKDVTNTTALQALRQTLPKMKIIVHRPDKIEYTIIEADLVKKPGKGFGLSVITRKTGKGVYVAEIINGGAAELDGRICRGDLLISVNGQIVEETPGEEVGALLKTLSGKVSLKFHRFKPVPSPR